MGHHDAAAETPATKPRKTSIQMDVPGVTLRPLSAKAKAGITKPEWRRALKRVGALAGSSQWWLGDLIAESEGVFGKHYTAVASRATGLKPATIRDYVYVARAVAPDVRRPDLTHGHHTLVASCGDKDEQRRLLALAAEGDGLTVDAFRRMLNRDKDPTPPSYEPHTADDMPHTADDIKTCPTCGQPVPR